MKRSSEVWKIFSTFQGMYRLVDFLLVLGLTARYMTITAVSHYRSIRKQCSREHATLPRRRFFNYHPLIHITLCSILALNFYLVLCYGDATPNSGERKKRYKATSISDTDALAFNDVNSFPP